MCVYVYVCVCGHIIFCGGDDDSRNIFTMQLMAIHTFSAVNKCTSCREILEDSNTHHTDGGFFIQDDTKKTGTFEKPNKN